MLKLLQIELFKIFKRPRTYIAFGAITAVVILFQVGMKFDGKTYLDLILNNVSDSFEVSDEFKSKLLNGYLPRLYKKVKSNMGWFVLPTLLKIA